MGHAIGRMRGGQHGGGAQPRALDDVVAEMLVEPGPPHRPHAVAGLQQGPHPRAGPATHQAEMAAMAARQDGGHGATAPLPTLLSPCYALNQPLASPVKEKYNPAAVRAQETISMAL